MDLLIFPFGGNSRESACVVEAVNKLCSSWNFIGFIDDNADKHGKEFGNYRVIGGRDKIADYPQAKVLAVPGRPDNYYKRDEIITSLNLPEERFATLIHPSAEIGIGTKIGYNTVIMAGVVITSNVTIGNNCVILPNTVISHDTKIGDYCMIGSNVSVSGGVTIEEKCYIGTGTKIIQEVTIGSKSLVGIGSVVIKNVESGSVVAGNPAKLIKRQTL